MRLLVLVVGLAIFTLSWQSVIARLEVRPVVISGGDLVGTVALAPIDADAFQRRLNQPPRFKVRPTVEGISYSVESDYWDDAVREDDESPRAENAATYYPESGFVRVRQGAEDAWIVIDLRQRALLDRYIRLAKGGEIEPQSGFLAVLTAASASEETSVQIGSRVLTPAEEQAFWRVSSGLRPLDTSSIPDGAAPPSGSSNSAWIIVTLPEGHAVEMLYTYATGTLVDGLGEEVYAVPRDWLRPAIGEYDGATLASLSASSIERDDPPGGWYWWPLMIGGGAACLVAAIWADRRLASKKDGRKT
jgi:hypothetical protein